MSVLVSVFQKFWKTVEKSDAKNHATQSLPEGIKEENDFFYINDGHVHHKLDVYYPAENNGRLPVIIDIHGGGWMYGDKELNKIYCEYIAARGFIVFNISYRLVPEVTVEGQLNDCAAALRWINENLDRFPADREKIMLTGDSAGGQLAAYMGAVSVSEKAANALGCGGTGLKFNCITLTSPVPFMNDSAPVNVYGRFMWGEPAFRRTAKEYLNLNEVTALIDGYPRTLLITSSGDFVARKQTLKTYEHFLKKGYEAKLLDYPKYNGESLLHVFAVLKPMGEAGADCIGKMCAFFTD